MLEHQTEEENQKWVQKLKTPLPHQISYTAEDELEQLKQFEMG